MLVPKKTKYKKCRKGRIHGRASSCNYLAFGDYGLMSMEPGRVDAKQFEAARKAISRALKRLGKVWIRAFCHTPVTKKPADVRMGKGKGSVELWICKVRRGMVLFEISGVTREVAKNALQKGNSKISVKCKVIDKE